MTLLDRVAPPVRPAPVADVVLQLSLAVTAGLLLGVGDLVWMEHVSYPWANLANSSAVWAIGAFVLGALLRLDAARSAVVGVAMMGVAVESYYGAAAILGRGDVATLWSPVAQMWLVFGVFAGVVFGPAGAWAFGASRPRAMLGLAAGAAVLLGEALHTMVHLDRTLGTFQSDLAQTAYAMAALGGILLLLGLRRPLVFVGACALAVPLTLSCSAAFSAAGIAY